MKALVLCGGIPQVALIKYLKSRGITVVLADMNETVVGRNFADIFYPVSVLDVNGIKDVAQKENVDCIITVCADQVLQVMAQISEMLNLPCYIDYKTATNVSSKIFMKKLLFDLQIPTSDYVILNNLDLNVISHLKFPLIVKPTDSYSSKGVKKVFTPDEFVSAFNLAMEFSRSHSVIVEEYIDGEELTVDIYVEDGKSHVLCISHSDKIGEDGKFVIHRTRNPALISDSVRNQIEDISQKIANALNLSDSPMLIQLIKNNDKVYVIEFCARTGGGVKFRLIEKVSGFDVVKAVADLTLGLKPRIDSVSINKKNKYFVNEFLYCKHGELDHLEGFEDLLKDNIISEYSQLKQKGTKFGDINSSSDRVAYFMVESEDYNELKEKHAKANSVIKAIDKHGNDIIRHDIVSKLW